MTKMNHAARLIIGMLGAVLIILVLAAVVLTYLGKPMPDKLVDMARDCVIGMFALLGRTGADAPTPTLTVETKP